MRERERERERERDRQTDRYILLNPKSIFVVIKVSPNNIVIVFEWYELVTREPFSQHVYNKIILWPYKCKSYFFLSLSEMGQSSLSCEYEIISMSKKKKKKKNSDLHFIYTNASYLMEG